MMIMMLPTPPPPPRTTITQVGQKGIGFKSVFCITERAQVHSNGYHILFDKTHSNKGMVCPTWLDPAERQSFEQARQQLPNSWQHPSFRTSMLLPLRRTVHAELYDNCMDVDNVLLFLGKLAVVVLDNALSGVVKVLSKTEPRNAATGEANHSASCVCGGMPLAWVLCASVCVCTWNKIAHCRVRAVGKQPSHTAPLQFLSR